MTNFENPSKDLKDPMEELKEELSRENELEEAREVGALDDEAVERLKEERIKKAGEIIDKVKRAIREEVKITPENKSDIEEWEKDSQRIAEKRIERYSMGLKCLESFLEKDQGITLLGDHYVNLREIARDISSEIKVAEAIKEGSISARNEKE